MNTFKPGAFTDCVDVGRVVETFYIMDKYRYEKMFKMENLQRRVGWALTECDYRYVYRLRMTYTP